VINIPDSPEIVWQPSVPESTALAKFLAGVGLDPTDYPTAWRWSVHDLSSFWAAVAETFSLRLPGAGPVLREDAQWFDSRWFPGAEVSFAEHAFRRKPADRVAIVYADERSAVQEMTWGELRELAARIRVGLQRLGVTRGDRVAAYLPNVPDTVAAFFAAASLGAIWSCAAPELGADAVIDRFSQIEPKVLLAVDGYYYAGRRFDRTDVVDAIHRAVGGQLVRFSRAEGGGFSDGFLGPRGSALVFEALPFEHPLWIVYSSGTTGLPKALVHSHGGILLEYVKMMNLHLDARIGDRVLWFTTTGWMMWNFLVGVLVSDASIVLYDGHPAYPDPGALWRLAELSRVTIFGTSPAFLSTGMKAGLRPSAEYDLSAVRAVGSTGAPLLPEAFDWVYDRIGHVWLFSMSGGTDLCTAFVGGVPTLPVYRGELQGRALGAAIEAFDSEGNSVVGQVGELVITRPMPSMPIKLWGDIDGSRYKSSYLDAFPNVWHHGDWIEITPRGTAVIYGRSDATINRGGIRIGTSEIYRSVLSLPEIADALVVDVSQGDATSRMVLFVVLVKDIALDDDLRKRITERIRSYSPRHAPDEVHAVAAVPRTRTGKLLEVPVKRILTGASVEEVVAPGVLDDLDVLVPFVAYARLGRTQPAGCGSRDG
jgi:acetoacetyl-CoA synthetase